MSRDSYYPQAYCCSKKSCGKISKHYIWTSEIEKAQHECECGQKLTYQHLYEEPQVDAPMILGKMTKSEIKADRRKRSQEHFKKEIMPTLNKKDKSHFKAKFGEK